MLVAKPDKKTEHMASLVSRQRNNREGYNVRTGQVLQAFGVPESNGQESEKSTRKVPKHLLSQIKELVNLRGALPLGNLFGVYEEEFGYRLEFKTLGFTAWKTCLPPTQRLVLCFVFNRNLTAGSSA